MTRMSSLETTSDNNEGTSSVSDGNDEAAQVVAEPHMRFPHPALMLSTLKLALKHTACLINQNSQKSGDVLTLSAAQARLAAADAQPLPSSSIPH